MSDAAPTALPFADALAAVLHQAEGRIMPTVERPIEQAVGYALAAGVVSRVALPPWDNAGMDGYAVQRADIHMPEVFSLTDQPRPGAGRLPALQLLLQLPLCRLGLLGHGALGVHPSA